MEYFSIKRGNDNLLKLLKCIQGQQKDRQQRRRREGGVTFKVRISGNGIRFLKAVCFEKLAFLIRSIHPQSFLIARNHWGLTAKWS